MICKENFYDDIVALDIYLYASAVFPVPDNVPVADGAITIDTNSGQTLGIKIFHAAMDVDTVSDDVAANGLIASNPTVKVSQQSGITPIIYTHEAAALVIANNDNVRNYISQFSGQYVYAVYVRADGSRLMSLPVPNTAQLVAEDSAGANQQLAVNFKCQSLNPLLSVSE